MNISKVIFRKILIILYTVGENKKGTQANDLGNTGDGPLCYVGTGAERSSRNTQLLKTDAAETDRSRSKGGFS